MIDFAYTFCQFQEASAVNVETVALEGEFLKFVQDFLEAFHSHGMRHGVIIKIGNDSGWG